MSLGKLHRKFKLNPWMNECIDWLSWIKTKQLEQSFFFLAITIIFLYLYMNSLVINVIKHRMLSRFPYMNIDANIT